MSRISSFGKLTRVDPARHGRAKINSDKKLCLNFRFETFEIKAPAGRRFGSIKRPVAI